VADCSGLGSFDLSELECLVNIVLGCWVLPKARGCCSGILGLYGEPASVAWLTHFFSFLYFFFLVGLGFELRALHLRSRLFTT
jgi:hypothetical protein